MLRARARVEAALDTVLPAPDIAPAKLHRAMRYAALQGGKRIRPLLVYASAELCVGEPQRADKMAAAVELIHVYSLVHDDLPAMDDDTLRRGKPTCHVEFDEATALLVGDSLQSLAFQILAEAGLLASPVRQLEMIYTLALASGSRGMAGGQAVDLESVGKSLTETELEFMHIHKTGALIRAAVSLGAASGSPLAEAEQEALDHYAKCVGLAFQVVDDVLDENGTTSTLGKTAGKDRLANKPTYVSAIGLSRAQAFAESLHADAIASLECFDGRGARLKQLADFIITRQF